MLANLWNILANLPVNPSYVAAFGLMFVVSATYSSGEVDNPGTTRANHHSRGPVLAKAGRGNPPHQTLLRR